MRSEVESVAKQALQSVDPQEKTVIRALKEAVAVFSNAAAGRTAQ
jgi:hypothetical protein